MNQLMIDEQMINYKTLFTQVRVLILKICNKMQIESSSSLTNKNEDEIYERIDSFSSPIINDPQNRIEIGSPGLSAISHEYTPFFQLLPLCLLSAFKQVHVLYFLLYAVFQFFQVCTDIEIVPTAVEVFLIIVCVGFQVFTRYKTYIYYTRDVREDEENKYQIWNKEYEDWDLVSFEELRVGQIIKIKKFTDCQTCTPVNILPICVASNRKEILIKTVRIDKRQELQKVEILKRLRKMVEKQHTGFQDQLFKSYIEYTFKSDVGNNFEAILHISKNQSQELYNISNQHIIPVGIPIFNQAYLIGIVMASIDSTSAQNLQTVLIKSNEINSKLSLYVFYMMGIQVVATAIIFIINISLSMSTHWQSNYGSYFGCYLLSAFSMIMNSIFISMYILIYIHRIVDSVRIFECYNIRLKNQVKSIDQFGQTDTLITDDYFFLEKGIPEEIPCLINSQVPLTQNLPTILKIMDQSRLLKEQFCDHVVPICKYFRLKPIKIETRRKIKGIILKERLLNQTCVQIKIQIKEIDEADGTNKSMSESIFILRFSDRPVFSALTKMRNPSQRQQFQRMIKDHQMTGNFLFVIEIMRQIQQKSVALEGSSSFFQLFCMFSFEEEIGNYPMQLVQSELILKKYSIMIMTSKKWKYFNALITKTQMRKTEDIVVMLEEKSENQMSQSFKNHWKIMKENKRPTKSFILVLHANMIPYLSRRSVRSYLQRMSEFCKYTIFYSCSQYQKQLCAANLFSIFPEHIYMSNYSCDYNVFKLSNLSVCERGSSSEVYATAIVNKYNDLRILILKQAIRSIQITLYIVTTHAFKNQYFVGCLIAAFFLLFRGGNIQLNQAYQPLIFLFFNFAFTILPIIYQIKFNPAIYVDQSKIAYINAVSLLKVHGLAALMGIAMTVLTYCLIEEEFIDNIYASILLHSVIVGNIFHLIVDDSEEKKGQIIVIVVQIAGSLTAILLFQILNYKQFHFVQIDSNYTISNVFFYVNTFLIVPVASTFIMYAYSASRPPLQETLKEKSADQANKANKSAQQLGSTDESTELIVKVSKGGGKQMRFRNLNYE